MRRLQEEDFFKILLKFYSGFWTNLGLREKTSTEVKYSQLQKYLG